MKGAVFLSLSVVVFCEAAHGGELGQFEQDRSKFLATVKCKNSSTTPAQFGIGRLYGCIAGKAETAKYFINEDIKNGKTKNIKIMWNDWFVDVGYGLHADEADAENLVVEAAKIYAPHFRDKLVGMMRQNKNKAIETDRLVFSYTFSPGPKINERLITISPK